jgi:hypothetical protein
MAPNTNRVISVADGAARDGTVTLANAVPAGATAVQINLTAANMTGPNFLQVDRRQRDHDDDLGCSTGALATSRSPTRSRSRRRERQIRVYCGNQTGSTHVIVDVFGYYL